MLHYYYYYYYYYATITVRVISRHFVIRYVFICIHLHNRDARYRTLQYGAVRHLSCTLLTATYGADGVNAPLQAVCAG